MTEYEEWFNIGLSNNWISPLVCATHDGIPTTEEEEQAIEEGSDPCCPVVRLWQEDDVPSSTWLSHWVYNI